MEGYVTVGKLVGVNTDKGTICIKDELENEETYFNIGDYELTPERWQNMLGERVECVIVDDKLHSISLIE